MMRSRLQFFVLTIFLQACSSSPAPIISLEQPPSIKITTHQVEPGDTLYSIAWRYDLTVGVLAQINQLSDPYVIKQGQILHLEPQSSYRQQSSTTVKTIVDKAQTVGRQIVSIVKKPTAPNVEIKPARTASDLIWQPPVKGKVIEVFNPKQLRKGIVYETKGGESVRPIANGKVVYAGDGLRDYGKLVIIKHSSDLLSAYGHNQKIFVSEGQVVKNDDIISKLGTNGRLYFEIRKDGKPVNPELYLN